MRLGVPDEASAVQTTKRPRPRDAPASAPKRGKPAPSEVGIGADIGPRETVFKSRNPLPVPDYFWLPRGYSLLRVLAEGGQGATAVVRGPEGVAVTKQFKPKKSVARIQKEIAFGRRAAAAGFGPRILLVDIAHRMFIMEAMDETLCGRWVRQGKRLTWEQMEELADLVRRCREAGIYHNDHKCLNIMLKDGRMFLIDYGFAKEWKACSCRNMEPDAFVTDIFWKISTDANAVFHTYMKDLDRFVVTHKRYLPHAAKFLSKPLTSNHHKLAWYKKFLSPAEWKRLVAAMVPHLKDVDKLLPDAKSALSTLLFT